MYIAEVFIENFRGFGAQAKGQHLQLPLKPGLNVLVGENDSGKSTIVDAIRIVLSTRSQDYYRIVEDDFHVREKTRADHLTIRLTFNNLTDQEVGRFLEWLSIDSGRPSLILTLRATRQEASTGASRSRRSMVAIRTGRDGEGPSPDAEAREYLQATYLRPLRDAEAELSAGKGSRLAQILHAHPDFKAEEADKAPEPGTQPTTIVEIMRQAEAAVQDSTLVKSTTAALNKNYLQPLSIGDAPLLGEMGIARDVTLRQILEKLELWLAPEAQNQSRTKRGLGLNNVLFMAAELLLLGGDAEHEFPILLIEEPEAHLHPQLQMRLVEFLESRTRTSEGVGPVQVLATTHSPNFASKVRVENIILVSQQQAYPLDHGKTRLSQSDYDFLRRFLDVTKANLFFARGVAIVEGDAENILLPTIAEKIGRPFTRYGVSVVSVGSRALLRYAHIFQRTDGSEMPVHVACIRDRDQVPEDVSYVDRKPRTPEDTSDDDSSDGGIDDHPESLAGGPVRVFTSPWWTLEYDLARNGFGREVYVSVKLALRAKKMGGALTPEDAANVKSKATQEYQRLRAEHDEPYMAALAYRPLWKKQCSKAVAAQFLAQALENDPRTPEQVRAALPGYLVEAIDHVTGATSNGA